MSSHLIKKKFTFKERLFMIEVQGLEQPYTKECCNIRKGKIAMRKY